MKVRRSTYFFYIRDFLRRKRKKKNYKKEIEAKYFAAASR